MRGMNKVYYLKIEIEKLQKEIKDLREEIKLISGANAINYSGMPHSTGVSDPTYNLALKREKLIDKLNQKIEKLVDKVDKLVDEIERIENIIEQIDDIEIRTIARMRFIENMKWEDIGEAVHLDRSVCSKKVRKYLQGMEL